LTAELNRNGRRHLFGMIINALGVMTCQDSSKIFCQQTRKGSALRVRSALYPRDKLGTPRGLPFPTIAPAKQVNQVVPIFS